MHPCHKFWAINKYLSIGYTVQQFFTQSNFYSAPSLYIQNDCTDPADSQTYSGKYDPVGATGLSTTDDSTDDRIIYKHSTATIYFKYDGISGNFTFTTTEPDSGLNQFNEDALSKFSIINNRKFGCS